MLPTIRVLIADDSFIGRKGLHQALEDVPDIEIVGEVDTLGLLLSQVNDLVPDVLILDLNWHGNEVAGLEYIRKLKAQKPELPILAITAHDHLYRPSLDVGADAAKSKNVSPDELRKLVRDLAARKSSIDYPDDALAQQCDALIRRLEETSAGHDGAKHFERIVTEILVFLFAPYLIQPHTQAETASGTQIRDLILENRGEHSFWNLMREQYGAAFIVVEIKNTQRVEEGHIRQLQDYLKPPLGKFGLLVARHMPDSTITVRQREAYYYHQCAIMTLDQNELIAMLRAKACGEDPSTMLGSKYSEWVRSF